MDRFSKKGCTIKGSEDDQHISMDFGKRCEQKPSHGSGVQECGNFVMS